MNKPINFKDAIRALKAPTTVRPEIREERLRTTAGLRSSPAVALSAWRGKSGRRYVVGVHAINADLTELAADRFGVVMAAVRDPATGIAELFDATRTDTGPDALELWRAAVTLAGATELHLHRLAESAGEAEAVVIDLTARPLAA